MCAGVAVFMRGIWVGFGAMSEEGSGIAEREKGRRVCQAGICFFCCSVSAVLSLLVARAFLWSGAEKNKEGRNLGFFVI